MTHSKRIHAMLIAAFLAVCVLGAGCTSQPEGPGTPTETPAPAEEFAFNETDNNTNVTLQAGSGITIHLAENPTTGYGWNVTSSRGLQYVNDTFIPPDTGLVVPAACMSGSTSLRRKGPASSPRSTGGPGRT